MPITFGYEVEFMSNTYPLASDLSTEGLAATDVPHPYHCDCDACDVSIDDPPHFRVQRDSSCEGEVISRVYDVEHWDEAVEGMQELQASALRVDAGVSRNCGMHVHIGNMRPNWLAENSAESRAASALLPNNLTAGKAWLAVEPALWEGVATAAFQGRRSMNRKLSFLCWEQVANWYAYRHFGESPTDVWRALTRYSAHREALLEDLTAYLEQMRWDRHCDLARAQHGGVFEVRIFNGTRAAWRMELACRMATMLFDADIARALASKFDEAWDSAPMEVLAYMANMDEASNLVSLDDLVALAGEYDSRLGELLMKQTGYAAARRQIRLPVELVISNTTNLSAIRHDAVLALLNQGTDPTNS